MVHLNDRGEVCHCGFGKHQPQVEWHLGAAQIEEEQVGPIHDSDLSFPMEPGRPFFYIPESNSVVIGPEGSGHWDLLNKRPGLREHPLGRQYKDGIDWFERPINDEELEQVEEALGTKTRSEDDWDFSTEPMPSEPDSEERQHDVQFSNDEPGVPTIDA